VVSENSRDAERGVLRPTAEAKGQDLLDKKGGLVLHRIVFDGEKRKGSYWVAYRVNDLPPSLDLKTNDEIVKLNLSPDEKRRQVGPITFAWGKGQQMEIKYGDAKGGVGLGQEWSSGPQDTTAPLADSAKESNLTTEIKVKLWGLVKYCAVSDKEEAEALAGMLGKAYSSDRGAGMTLVLTGEPAVPALANTLKTGTPDQQRMAMSCMEAMYARSAVPDIIPLLDAPDWSLAEAAAYTLGKLGDPRAVEPLMKVVQQDRNEILTVGAIGALGRIGDKRAVPLFEELLKSERPRKRVAAAGGLGLMGRRDGLDLAVSELRNKDVAVSTDAMYSVWAIGGEQAQKALAEFSDEARAIFKAGDRKFVGDFIAAGKFSGCPAQIEIIATDKDSHYDDVGGALDPDPSTAAYRYGAGLNYYWNFYEDGGGPDKKHNVKIDGGRPGLIQMRGTTKAGN
jgi:hypothetical protein